MIQCLAESVGQRTWVRSFLLVKFLLLLHLRTHSKLSPRVKRRKRKKRRQNLMSTGWMKSVITKKISEKCLSERKSQLFLFTILRITP